MNPLSLARAALVGAAALAAVLGGMLAVSTPVRLPRLEPLPRNRAAGWFLGCIALAMCVPHAAVVAPDFLLPLLSPVVRSAPYFLLPFLSPVALAAPWICAFYVDNPTARAVGGLMILRAYEVVHRTFECRFFGAPVCAAAAWLFGLAGIWLSGYPSAMRDALRLAARRRGFRIGAACGFGVLALLFAAAAVVGRGAAR